MGKKIKITGRNADECREALGALRLHLAKLVRMTKDYPLECSFAGYRFIFTSESDIQELIQSLDSKLVEFRAAA